MRQRVLTAVTVITIFLIAPAGIAAVDHCADYSSREQKYMNAIRAVAIYRMQGLHELCTLPGLMDIEAQPTRVILRDGEVIPHVSVQLHRETDSCLYKVRDADSVITEAHCYSSF